MKRKINLIVLLVFVAANVITPFSYAGLEGVEENSEVLLESLDEENPTSGEIEMQGNAENSLFDGDETGVDNENLNSESDLVGDVQNEYTLKTDDENSTMSDVPEESGLGDLEESGDEIDSNETDELDENVDVNNDIAVRSLKMRNSNLLGSPNPVKSVVYNEGNITYTDTNGKVFSGIGTITITSGSESITILDRNLGATEVFNNDYENPNSESYGYHFQWGNNYGFAPVENDSSDFALNETIIIGSEEGYADTSKHAWNNPYVSSRFIINDDPFTVQYELQNDGNWDKEPHNNDLWGGEGDLFNELGDSTSDYKRQGPCPEGYHVPSARDFNKLIEMYHALSGDEVELWDSGYGYQIQADDDSAREFMFSFINTFKIPFAGYRSLGDAAVYEMMDSAGNEPSIYLWTSSASLSQSWALTFSPYYDWLSLEMMQDRGDARSIRCFKDSQLEGGSEPLVLKYETNGGSAMQAQTIPEGENAYLPGYTTHKDGYVLVGWYDENLTEEYDIGDNGATLTNLIMSSDLANNNGEITIYAKWAEECKVIFKDWNGAELAVIPVAKGTAAVYTGIPTREGYVFSGWDIDLSNITEDVEATAQYKPAYNVTFRDWDGTDLAIISVAEGGLAEYEGVPTREGYVFSGWDADLSNVTENIIATAQYINVGVVFDANGGIFEDGGDKYVVNSTTTQILTPETKYAHTSNIDDDGTVNGDYDSDSEWGENTVVRIPGAKNLHVDIKFGGECDFDFDYFADYLTIWTGEHPEYNKDNHIDYMTYNDYSFWGWELCTLENEEIFNLTGDIQGDSLTFLFISDGNYNTYNGYGYYAVVSGTGITYLVEYDEGDFDNVPEPTKEGYKFIGWYVDDNTKFNSENVSTGEMTNAYAKWDCMDGYINKGGKCVEKGNNSSYSRGGSGRSNTSHGSSEVVDEGDDKSNPPRDEDRGDDKSNLSEDVDKLNDNLNSSNTNVYNSKYTEEMNEAYSFAKGNGITTTSSIENAKMYGNLTRIQMAKMLSQFSINVLGKQPDTTLNNKFNDVSEDLDKQYDDGVTLSFQLGIMGQNMPNNRFRPNDEVSRAEFVAAFSRMLYGTSDGEYRSTRNYYKPHMSKLYNEGIVSDTNPNMKERRGYVMIMLMRSIKSN